MAAKRRFSALAPEPEEPVDPSDELMFLCLGGGNEVGRSCHIVEYKGKTVMLDAGQHPAYDGHAALPYFDEYDLSKVDVLLITHFHLDHAAALPYVLAKTNFKGRVFMTHPTKAIYKWLIQDAVRVQNLSSSSDQRTALYTEAEHLETFHQIEAIDYHTTHTVSSIRFTPYPAGHVLGAAMYLIEIAGLKILFTGDFSREHDRHLIPAEIPKNTHIDVLITESTYGVASHIPRQERENALMKSVTGIVNRGGRALLPVFALGRAQELLLILDDYWARHPEYQNVPIFYASNLARKCMIVYQTYISAMNDNIKRMFREGMAESQHVGAISSSNGVGTNTNINNSMDRNAGPWDFRHIRSLKNLDRFDDTGSCVVLASPGMLQSGVSRELLERWAPSEKNGVVITGYSVEGTMAKQLVNEPDAIPSIMGRTAANNVVTRKGGEGERPMVQRRCSVQEFSFAAHVDGVENQGFIREVGAKVVILVHGEKHNMARLRSKLLSLNHDLPQKEKVKIFSPANTEELRIPFRLEKTARVVGRLAEVPPPQQVDDEPRVLEGVLVQNDFKLTMMSAEDLKEYAGLNTTRVLCKQRLTLGAAGVELVRWALEGVFGGVEELGKPLTNGTATNGKGAEEDVDGVVDHNPLPVAFMVMDTVIVRLENDGSGRVSVEWEGNYLNDGIADAVLAVLFGVESSPAAVKQSALAHQHGHHGDGVEAEGGNVHANVTPQQRFERLCMFLEAQFGDQITPIRRPKILFPRAKQIKDAGGVNGVKSEEEDIEAELGEDEMRELEGEEMERLIALGVPVPGVEVKVDKNVARVWLEDLEVECANAVLRDRVRAVVERAVETVSPLTTGRGEGR